MYAYNYTGWHTLGFYRLLLSMMVCIQVSMCVHPKANNNYSFEIKLQLPIKPEL